MIVKCKYNPYVFTAPTFKEAIQMAIGVLGDIEIQYMSSKRNYFGYVEISIIPK